MARATIREAAKRIGEAGDRVLSHRLFEIADHLDSMLATEPISPFYEGYRFAPRRLDASPAATPLGIPTGMKGR